MLLLGMEQDLNTRLANLSLQIQKNFGIDVIHQMLSHITFMDVGDWRLTVTEPKFIIK